MITEEKEGRVVDEEGEEGNPRPCPRPMPESGKISSGVSSSWDFPSEDDEGGAGPGPGPGPKPRPRPLPPDEVEKGVDEVGVRRNECFLGATARVRKPLMTVVGNEMQKSGVLLFDSTRYDPNIYNRVESWTGGSFMYNFFKTK